MGLTIHWQQKNKQEKIDLKKAQECVDFVEFVAKHEGWEVLKKWNKVIKIDDFEVPAWREDEGWEKPRGGIARNIGISVHPHKDCESVVIAFDTTNGKLLHYRDFGGGRKGWIDYSEFCKTHYAGFKVHKKVCRLLAAIDKMYIPLEVSDEGEYYGKWDDEHGLKVFGEYVEFVNSVGQQLADNFGAQNIHAAKDNTDGWKEDYIDSLIQKFKEKGKRGKK